MSDIEIGSVWVDKIDKSTLEVLRENYDGRYYVNSSDGGECYISHENIIAHYEPEGRKDDSEKRRYSLLPSGTVNSVVDVLEYGCIKYSPENWQTVLNARTRYYDAAMRHLDAWFNGEVKDSETGLPHLAHAICCLMFLMWFDSEAGAEK